MLDARVEAATREFATKLRHSPPFEVYWRAKERLEGDGQAQMLLADFQGRQRQLMLKQQMSGGITQEEIDGLRTMQSTLRDNPVIMEYFESMERAARFIPELNRYISGILGVDFGALSGLTGGAC